MARTRHFTAFSIAAFLALLIVHVHGQVTAQRIASSTAEPQNWLTYSGNYSS